MVLYAIILSALIVISCVSFLLWRYFASRVLVVKAGNINIFQWRYSSESVDQKPQYVYAGRQLLNTAGLEYMLVKGNSMRFYGIHDRDHVLVEPIDKFGWQKLEYEKPVVLFSVHDHNGKWFRNWKIFESHYKLRKFITYLQLDENEPINFAAMYDRHEGEITVSKEEFVKRCNERVKELTSDTCYVLSETYDCSLGRNRYSIHGVSNLIGTVKCNLPQNENKD